MAAPLKASNSVPLREAARTALVQKA
jgi:hypothetical protein